MAEAEAESSLFPPCVARGLQEASSPKVGEFGVVIGADLVYNRAHAISLSAAIRASLAGAHPREFTAL